MKNTLQIHRDDYTDIQWKWLTNNWENMHEYGRQLMDEEFEDDESVILQTPKLVQVDGDSFHSKEDYLEFRDIDEEILENQIVEWYYSFRCENNCSGSVYKTGE